MAHWWMTTQIRCQQSRIKNYLRTKLSLRNAQVIFKQLQSGHSHSRCLCTYSVGKVSTVQAIARWNVKCWPFRSSKNLKFVQNCFDVRCFSTTAKFIDLQKGHGYNLNLSPALIPYGMNLISRKYGSVYRQAHWKWWSIKMLFLYFFCL